VEGRCPVESLVGKKILVTGHSGFKGYWLVHWLKMIGAVVEGYSLPARDVRDIEGLRYIMGTFKPDIVFHLAAQALVRRSYAHPIETYSTNVMGTVNVLNVLREYPCPAVIITSDKCYAEHTDPRTESDELGGYDPYSSSKACAELVCEAYVRSYGLNIVTARAGNCIGGGDWSEDRLIPDCINALDMGRPIVLRNPDAVRPFQHVLEPLQGYLMLADRLLTTGLSGAWNFGPDEVWTVRDVVELVIECWGSGSWEHDASQQPHENPALLLDSGKARRNLGWKPTWTTEQSIRKTMEWYKSDEPELEVVRQIMEIRRGDK
jgi:CDP-glucose 4,6-dehydratase